MKHIMMDLETRGTVPGCVVFSIGLVEMDFDRCRLTNEFYSVISIASCLEAFLEEDPATIKWWNQQKPEARMALEHANHPDAPSLEVVMRNLNAWLRTIGATVGKTRLYGNGADFDNPILRVMQKAANVQPFDSPAGFFGGRCYRTLKTLDELFGPAFAFTKLVRAGTHHNALDDAKSQALHLMQNVQRIRDMGNNLLDDGK